MSIYIKGVKMPKTCYECPCQYDLISCQALDFESICEEDFDCTTQRLPNCPLEEAEPKHAYVIIDEDGNMECSNCGSGNCFDNYCGHCGAKLED